MAVKITFKNDGPIRVESDTPEELILCDANGKTFEHQKTAVSLCRCAASKNLPFCDGSHGSCGFQSKVEARSLIVNK